jgi:hypothetical protein
MGPIFYLLLGTYISLNGLQQSAFSEMRFLPFPPPEIATLPSVARNDHPHTSGQLAATIKPSSFVWALSHLNLLPQGQAGKGLCRMLK